ncbi:MAG: glucosylceramidase [Chitinophagaceae bacterium]|nr:MAG: glucosylceramidase [Chitinophagaceae bacterium]
MKNKTLVSLFAIATLFLCGECKKSDGGGGGTTPPPVTPPVVTNEVDFWLTNGNQSSLLQKQTTVLGFGTTANAYPFIDVDSAAAFQTIDGFGFTLTGSSAQLINTMGATEKANLLNELFSSNGIGISYLRVSIGASDLSPSVFSYNDLPAGQTDPTLANFSLSQDLTHLVPVLKEILLINPNIKIMGSPWSPPVWMKDNGLSMGGSLLPQYYSTYANYFVKYINAMKAQGITIDAITIQNEPQHGGNNPSMVMSAAQQATFIKANLGPAFQAASLPTKIVIWDHNCDNPDYPKAILNDPAAKAFVDGSAFHLYAGDISALSNVRSAHPDKNIYFTEQWTSSTGSFDGDLKWHLKNVIIGSMRNYSKVALEWNLANDPSFGPHTPGGCTQCKGAITISGSSVTKNVGYYIVAHASKFVPAGSTRINSTIAGALSSVAFKTPAGKKVMIVVNDGTAFQNFNIRYKGKWISSSLNGGSVGTYVW